MIVFQDEPFYMHARVSSYIFKEFGLAAAVYCYKHPVMSVAQIDVHFDVPCASLHCRGRGVHVH